MRYALFGIFLLSSACALAADAGYSRTRHHVDYLIDDLEARSSVFRFIEANDGAGLYNYLRHNQPRFGWDYVLNNLRNNSGLAAFHRAVVQTPRPNTYILGVLVHYGANPNLALDQDVNRHRFRQGQFYAGWTAAHMAERLNLSPELKSLLASLGCDFERPDTQGWTPAMVNGKQQKRGHRRN